MRFFEIIVLVIFGNVLTCSSLERDTIEEISPNTDISNDDKVNINFGDLAIEVRPPIGRKHILSTTEPIYQKWALADDDVDDRETIYDSTGERPIVKDRPRTNDDAIEPNYVKAPSEEVSSEEHEYIRENSSQPIEQHWDDRENNSSDEKIPIATDSSQGGNDQTTSLRPLAKLTDREKRQTYDMEEEIDSDRSPQRETTRKGRTLPMHQDGSPRSRRKSSEHLELSSKNKVPNTRDENDCECYINLDVDCSDETTKNYPECHNTYYNLRTPRDGSPVSLEFVRTYLNHGHELARNLHERAKLLATGGLRPSPHTPSMLNFFHSKAEENVVRLNQRSELLLFGTKLLQSQLLANYNITPENFIRFLDNHRCRIKTDDGCQSNRSKRCDGGRKFRNLDGSCNNAANPTWGRTNTAFARLLPPRYSDGIHGMPISVTNAELPNARKLSVALYERDVTYDTELTLAVMQWGQTLAHDLGRQVMDQTAKGGIECCADDGKGQLPPHLRHHSCAPIPISGNDIFYSIRGQRCMNFVRAMTVPKEECKLGTADQLNGGTSFLDCSPMYGVDKSSSDDLREFTGGRMKVEFRSGRWLLPTSKNRSHFCDIMTSDDICYRSGDPRTNQNPQLVILQTLLVREHNRVATALSALNPHWDDERLFQEARRIVIAEYQHITYNEWLPLLLGDRRAEIYGLSRTNGEMSNDYNDKIDPSTLIGFTSGAFRSLHSMIDGCINLCNFDRNYLGLLRLSDHYFRPKVIEEDNNFERLLRGLVTQPMQMQDMNLHSELTEYLFRSRNNHGMDLAAIDIQRGRDHGVPSYNAYRKICHLQPINDFDDLIEDMSWANVLKLRENYAHVDDIDLIVGATMEDHTPGSYFGPTNLCIISEQFYRSRIGDKYFYDNANFSHSFTQAQFNEIRKVTLARLLCDADGGLAIVQREAFRTISRKNSLVPCEELPKMDLALWKEGNKN